MNARQSKRRRAGGVFAGLKQSVAATAVASLLVAASSGVLAADCPVTHDPGIPAANSKFDKAGVNIDALKDRLKAYHAGKYVDDITAVIADAKAYVDRRADQVRNPAVVLDIDETSLTNWDNLHDNDFGFIKDGPCPEQPSEACGFNAWILLAHAAPIEPTRTFFNALRARNVSVFFITGRRTSQRDATLLNLDHAGYEGWTRLITRPDDDTSRSIVPFKSGERKKIADAGYTILATIGDQQSDIDGGAAECGFKLPNPFYFIE
jgi:hypothetical protein